MKPIPSCCIAALCLLLAGCASHEPPLAAERFESSQKLNAAYPQSFRALHRAVLTVRGKDYIMNGYVLVRRPGEVRLRAASEMGGVLFDLVQAGETQRVLENQTSMRDSWLLKGALRDVRMMYLPQSAGVPNSDYELTILEWKKFEGGGEELPSSFYIEDRNLGYRVSVQVLDIKPVEFSGKEFAP